MSEIAFANGTPLLEVQNVSRFFGILGILAGVLMLPILRIDAPGIVRSFFFISLGLMFLGRWMGGRTRRAP